MVLMVSSSCGCSYLIAKSGISYIGEFYSLQTQAEVREKFGEADETRTCPGGQIVEHRWIRKQIPIFKGWYDDPILYGRSFGMWEIFGFPITAIRSELAKLHYSFVYDQTGRLLYLYDLKEPLPKQFNEAVKPSALELYRKLTAEKCDTWSSCITDYIKEARQRADFIGYPLGAEEEQEFEDLLSIGERVDSGLLLWEKGLYEIREALEKRFRFVY
jgi:hypothetical protein